jgi:enoyl-CoA hydratase/carnithine racemase
MSEQNVIVQQVGNRLDIILNRPDRKNAITQQLAVELRDAFLNVPTDVGCILLSGSGGAFCSGIDLKVAGADLKNEPLTAWVEVHAAIYQCRVPIVVALERYAINAGAALALAANVVVAGETSFLQVGEIAMGVAAPMCQAWLHLKHSPSVADRVVLVGDRIVGASLTELGLVSEIVADSDVAQRARDVADHIASHPQRGRDGISRTWDALRGRIDDPDEWFASLIRKF